MTSDDGLACCCLQGGTSALMEAIYKGHMEITVKLIAAGTNLDLQNEVRKSE